MSKTLVSFHAHPDDEAIATGGAIARAAKEGWRVVLVVATRGDHGEVADGFLYPGETLAERREKETARSAEILGIQRVEFLDYVDSGMAGTPENDAPGSFWSADIDEAAERLARILREEDAEILTIYDERGVYDHPDHIQVHRVGIRAAELAQTPRVYEATVNMDAIREVMRDRLEEARAAGIDPPGDIGEPDDFDLGVPASRVTTTVDVREFADLKRTALAAHASQVDDTSFFLAMPVDAFRDVFGVEWFIRRGAPPGTTEDSLIDGAGQPVGR
jgi:LmbE family N-acetylglucosaminyl deacetylase